MTIVTMHRVNEAHLAEVMEVAKQIGSVTINAYYDGEMYYALEGVHRTEAAKRCRLPIILVEKELDDLMYTDCEDVEDRDENGMATVEDVFMYGYDNMIQHSGGVYNEDDFASVEVA